jgi:hypothetical protein
MKPGMYKTQKVIPYVIMCNTDWALCFSSGAAASQNSYRVIIFWFR